VTLDQPRHHAEASVPETRYPRSGDLHIAYQTLGDGPPDLVFVAAFTSHLKGIDESWQLLAAA
jgi:hypothetical protein